MFYTQIKGVRNEPHRLAWVEQEIQNLGSLLKDKSVLDAGAGLSPFKPILELQGFKYMSHDFNSYTPNEAESPGLQNSSWDYPKHDFSCDIIEIPVNQKYNLVLCTEVLEHVPDPVAALGKLVELCEQDGYIVLTFPFISLMHQAPYWFSSGLSPFWVKHWSEKYKLEIVKLEVSGDYLDFFIQEFTRLVTSRFVVRGVSRAISLLRIIRPFVPKRVLQAGGFSTLVVLRKY
jgi:2-polyprenyl-3-methyl-5-hydroxy-6-metoxy-1,4-benzoquinol methylase